MKKIIFLLSIFFIPLYVLAVEPDYDVNGYYSNIEIKEDGSAFVREAIILDGDFNGYERILRLTNSNISRGRNINLEGDAVYNPKGILNLKVATYEIENEDRSLLDEVSNYSKLTKDPRVGSKNVYEERYANEKEIIRSYYSCTNCKVAFYFEYTLKDVVVLHNDVAEMYYQLFSASDVTEDMGKIDIKVSYPNEDSEALMWVHGNVYGTVKRNDNSSFLIGCDDFTSGSLLDFRTVFSKDNITNLNLENTSINALDKIKEIEKQRDEERQKEIERILRIIKTLKTLNIIYVLILILVLIYVFFKYDKEFKTDFFAKYNREFIDDYGVEVIDYLMNKSITPNAMSASVMNLIYRKNIEAELINEKKKEYKFILKNREKLSNSESLLVDFLFNKVGDGTSYTTKQLKSYAKSTKTYESFNNSYTAWRNSVIKEGGNQNFYLSLFSVKLFSLIYVALGFILWFFNICIRSDVGILSIFAFIGLLVITIYLCAFTKRTERGALHYKKWKAFKNFLKDFGTFDIKELPEVVLWERYLVYAIIFGLADKVQASMNVKISEMEKAGMDVIYYNDALYFHDYVILSSAVNSSINSAHNLAVSTAAAQNVSNASGTGGGFSSGGGFGGGGGGGHGF